MNNRRSFLRSLGGAVAAAMLPFSKPIHLSAPKKAKAPTTAFWYQTMRRTSHYSPEYLAYMSKLEVKAINTIPFSEPSMYDFVMKDR